MIYISFIVLDLVGADSSFIKYAGILLCLLMCVLSKKALGSTALLFTAFADYFLLILDDHYCLGIASFIIVQLIYSLSLRNNEVNNRYPIRGIAIAATVLMLSVMGINTLENMLALSYFSLLFGNCLLSFTNKKLGLFSCGLTLFVLCDICVGLHNVLTTSTLYEIVSFMMWIFYLPSQVLITLHFCEDDLSTLKFLFRR